MKHGRSRASSGYPLVLEALESRVILSGMTAAKTLHETAALVASMAVKDAKTTTSLAVSAGTLTQPITFTVTVRGPAAAGSPTGTVNIMVQGAVIESLTLSPTTSSSPNYAFSDATYTLTQQPGGSAYFFGKHTVSAVFVPSGPFSKSKASKSFSVPRPAYTTLAGGVEIATVAQGSGPEIQSGQTANVYYTGYLAKNGHIFDDSVNDGGTPLSFTLGAGLVIPGFDSGTVGMRVGETRIILISPAEGYGRSANGPIPANSTLIFVVTLESIS
jgi:hypothetical protein